MARMIDQSSEALPGPGGPGDEHVGAVDPDQPHLAVLAAADRQCPQIHVSCYGQGGDDGGQGVAADELQHQRTRRGGADPAQHGAEAVGEVVRPAAKSAADWPDTSWTGTRSVKTVAETLPSTGSITRPW
jgi:hypothetical protein